MRIKNIFKILLWLFLFILLFAGLNFLVQPIWVEWGTYDTVSGFYEEPEDTIEVIFVGPSDGLCAIIPMELYEKYGICAYNLATEAQPMMASYYWLEEAYRKHSQTLKVVVLSPSTVTYDSIFYRKAIDGMELSSVKYNAVKEYSNKLGDTIANLLPLYVYHERWKNFEQADFKKINYSANIYVRGYFFRTGSYLNTGNILQTPRYLADNDEERILNKEEEKNFKKVVDFCDKHGLDLMIVRLAPWADSTHNMVKNKVNMYNLEFLDFFFDPIFSEMEFNLATDTIDGVHSNYYGAEKVTAYMGNCLKTKYQLTDVREDKKYSYMKEQLDEYHASVSNKIMLNEMVDPTEYLSVAASNNDYTVFIVGKDDAANSITQEQRDAFAVMGLTELSTLEFRDSYLAVFDRGELLCEQLEHCRDARGDSESIVLSYKGRLDGGSGYSLESAGESAGNNVSCVINGTEYAKNQRGLNIVIYDNKLEKVIDSTCFDTYGSSVRDGLNLETALKNAEECGKSFSELSVDLQKLYLYNRRCENKKTSEYLKQNITEDGLFTYLSAYWKDDYIIYLSVMDEAAGMMDDTARACLAEWGLNELSQLEWWDSYLGIINSGQVVYEQKDHGSVPITTRYFDHVLESGGLKSKYCHSSIIIDGTEYSPNSRGINIVVYDTMTKEIVDTAVFDTYANPIKVLKDY